MELFSGYIQGKVAYPNKPPPKSQRYTFSVVSGSTARAFFIAVSAAESIV
jgi:hypothetical protein